MDRKELTFLCAYSAVYSGSRKPAVVIANGFPSAVSKAMVLCKDDELETELLSITLIDVVAY